MRPLLFWVVTQRMILLVYRRFGQRKQSKKDWRLFSWRWDPWVVSKRRWTTGNTRCDTLFWNFFESAKPISFQKIAPPLCLLVRIQDKDAKSHACRHGCTVLKKISSATGCWAKLWELVLQMILMYVGGSISFRPDIQRPRQMQNALRYI